MVKIKIKCLMHFDPDARVFVLSNLFDSIFFIIVWTNSLHDFNEGICLPDNCCKSLCNLQELYTAFKEKHSNVNTGFSKFFAFRPKWCVLVGSKMTHSVCVCSAHQNVVLLVDTMD